MNGLLLLEYAPWMLGFTVVFFTACLVRVWCQPEPGKRRPPSAIDLVLQANHRFAQAPASREMSPRPSRRLAVVTCMDCRLPVEPMLGLHAGEAHILRNAGGIVTEDTLRSLILSQHVLGTREVILIGHTDCGLSKFKDDELLANLERKTGHKVPPRFCFHAFADLEKNLRQQIGTVKSHPWIDRRVIVRGFICDVHTGKLSEVREEGPASRAG